MNDHLEKWDNVFHKGESSSLLNQGQFNSIIYGSCPEKNGHFNGCAKLSQKSSVDSPECLEQKLMCEASIKNEQEEKKETSPSKKPNKRSTKGVEVFKI